MFTPYTQKEAYTCRSNPATGRAMSYMHTHTSISPTVPRPWWHGPGKPVSGCRHDGPGDACRDVMGDGVTLETTGVPSRCAALGRIRSRIPRSRAADISST